MKRAALLSCVACLLFVVGTSRASDECTQDKSQCATWINATKRTVYVHLKLGGDRVRCNDRPTTKNFTLDPGERDYVWVGPYRQSSLDKIWYAKSACWCWDFQRMRKCGIAPLGVERINRMRGRPVNLK